MPQTDIERGLQLVFAQETVRLFHPYVRKKGDLKAEVRQERHRQ